MWLEWTRCEGVAETARRWSQGWGRGRCGSEAGGESRSQAGGRVLVVVLVVASSQADLASAGGPWGRACERRGLERPGRAGAGRLRRAPAAASDTILSPDTPQKQPRRRRRTRRVEPREGERRRRPSRSGQERESGRLLGCPEEARAEGGETRRRRRGARGGAYTEGRGQDSPAPRAGRTGGAGAGCALSAVKAGLARGRAGGAAPEVGRRS